MTGNYTVDTTTSDFNGNLTFDGVYGHSGTAFDTMAYDGRGRRISKALIGTGQWDCTYNYYYNGDSDM